MIRFHLVFLGALSFAVSILATPLVRGLCRRWRIYDTPSGDPLKIHRAPVPRLGGLAVALGILATIAAGPLALTIGGPPVIGLCLGGLLITVLGAVDDVIGLRPSYRLGGHVVATVVLVWVGKLFPVSPEARAFALPLIFLGLVVAINAMNLIDGLDGLASGVAALAAGGYLALAVIRGDAVSQVLALATLGASLGFLPYNFTPASIFLGDCGSTLLGCILGTIAARLISEAGDLRGALAPLPVLFVPFFDTSLAIGRRWLRGRPIFEGDRSHFYDWLVERGLTQRAAVSLCYGLGALGSGVAVMITR